MIYFDNAATTYPKPPEVIKTMSRATVRYGANPGRGGHKMSYLTSEAVYETRKRVAEFFGTDAPENVIFTKNCTEALNIVIKGLCVPGCRFICSSLDHNAVIRPLEALRRSGTADYDIAPVGKTDDETAANFKRLFRSNTRAVICTGASYERYSRACIQAMEFAALYAADEQKLRYLEEHGECLIREKALKKLRV